MEKSSDWIELPDADYDGFAKEVRNIGSQMLKNTGMGDFNHLLKIRYFYKLAGLIGYLTSFIPNPLSIYLISQTSIGNLLIAHHIGHGAYENIEGIPKKYKANRFGIGNRRFIDWFTWWDTKWWRHLHNGLHHANTQHVLDADLMDSDNFTNFSKPVRILIFIFFAATWQFSYYAPYMQREWYFSQKGSKRTKPNRFYPRELLNLRDPLMRELWFKYYIPYILFRFIIMPMLFLPLGWWAVAGSAFSLILGEIVANIQGFMFIRSSHASDEIPIFKTQTDGTTDYYARQVLGTVNYNGGSDFIDFTSVWTCSQIEHHLWPEASMLKIQESRKTTQALCHKYDLPYRQKSIFMATREMYKIFVGKSSQKFMDMSSFKVKRQVN